MAGLGGRVGSRSVGGSVLPGEEGQYLLYLWYSNRHNGPSCGEYSKHCPGPEKQLLLIAQCFDNSLLLFGGTAVERVGYVMLLLPKLDC